MLGRRKGFGHVVQVNRQLINILKDKRGVPVDLDNATLRVTLDVIGRVGFGKDFGATRDLSDGRANLAFDMMAAGEHSLRKYILIAKGWWNGMPFGVTKQTHRMDGRCRRDSNSHFRCW